MSNYQVVRETFPSLAAFVDYANGSTDMTDERSSRMTGNAGLEFTNTASYADASKLAHGWQEGASRVEAARVKLTVKGQKPRRETVMREVGPGVLSMGNFLSGHPQPYVTIQDRYPVKAGKGKVIRLVVNLSVSGGITPNIIERRGGAVLALVNSLERAGKRCEVFVIIANAPTTTTKAELVSEFRVMVKAAHEKLNLPTLAFALVHPSMYRRFGFSAFERQDAAWRRAHRIGGSYGSVIAGGRDMNADVFLGQMHLSDMTWQSEAKAAEWVRESALAQGVEII